jgi:protein-L-isoaspartate(D-aspartate) O-methyltransferase
MRPRAQPRAALTRRRARSVEAAFRRVDRARYTAAPYRGEAYVDSPLPIGFGQTISAPHMHAACTEELLAQLQPGARVLDVGSGSGYLTAVFAGLVRPGGRVTGVEVVPPLVERSRQALQEDAGVREAAADGVRVAVHEADAHWGWPADAPYDAIHVGAGAAAAHTRARRRRVARGWHGAQCCSMLTQRGAWRALGARAQRRRRCRLRWWSSWRSAGA